MMKKKMTTGLFIGIMKFFFNNQPAFDKRNKFWDQKIKFQSQKESQINNYQALPEALPLKALHFGVKSSNGFSV